MEKVHQTILLFYIFCVMFFVVGSSEGDAGNRRVKRYLAFGNISHFFVRMNTKTNSVAWNQIFAQTMGFRINWDEPPDSFHPHHHLVRRTVYSNLETLLDRNGLNGICCVRRAVCEVQSIKEAKGIYYKILSIIFRRHSAATDKWHNVTAEDCQQAISACPFSLLDVSPYTDL